MRKWIGGVLGAVVAGLLVAYSTNFLGLGDNGRKENGNGLEMPVVMGALEIGTNRQGFDFNAFGEPTANAELCAEMCRADPKCDAMTFVKSTGICWLKSGVPAASADADMVSSVKVKRAG